MEENNNNIDIGNILGGALVQGLAGGLINNVMNTVNARPFFSIIIPCYNTKKENLQNLFQSIVDGGCSKDIEIIIADGRSTDTSYQKEVEKFKEETNIPVTIVTMPDKDENGVELVNCPGNTREYGVRAAKGQWITFIDHDDMFFGEVFTDIKNLIEETKEEHIVCSQILQVDPLDEYRIIQEIKYATNWMHGKFYNLDNLWKAYDFHFKTNLVSNEDIYISNRLHNIIYQLKHNKVAWLNKFTYLWNAWPDSTSHKKYSDQLSYMEYYFYDYIDATYNVHVSEYEKALANNSEMSDEDKQYYMHLEADALLFEYFYLQSFKYHNENWLPEHEKIVKKNIADFYSRFGLSPIDLYEIACTELDNDDVREGGFITKIWYNNVRYSVIISCGHFIETDSFKDFISNVEDKVVEI